MMLSKFRKTLRDESGQGMTEYIIIVALIAIAAIGVVSFFGDNIRALFGASAEALSGNEGATPTDHDLHTSAASTTGHRNLRNFGNTNGGS